MAEETKIESKVSPPIQSVAHLNIPFVYANGVQIGMTATEVQITLITNNRPTQVIALPLSVAKATLEGLSLALTDYEQKTGISITNLGQLREKLKPTL